MEHTRDDEGATAVEYAFMASLIAGVIVLAVTALGTHVVPLFDAACAIFPGGTC